VNPESSLAGLSLRDLEYAVAVAELRHFGRAAERCGVSQSALSEQVRKLERLLDVALFERSKRRVSPTPRGAELLRQAAGVLAGARELVHAARRNAEPLSGELRLGAIATLGPYYLPALLREVRERFPKLTLRVQEGQTAPLLGALQQGALEAALFALPVRSKALRVEPLFFEPFRLACPAAHKLAMRPEVRLRDLRGHELLLLEEGHCLRDQALSLCGSRRRGGPVRFATSLEMLRHMIGAGEGFTLMPTLAAQAGDMDGLVTYRDLADAEAGRTIALAWRASEPRDGDLRHVAAYLQQRLPPGVAPRRGIDGRA
jgi:LysR family hydrogen peroxide-inducible transcriptional activator